jgi:hypothetical protein
MATIPLVLGIMRLIKLKDAGQLYFGASTILEGLDALTLSSISFKEYAWLTILLVKISIVLFLAVGILYVILKKKYNGTLFLITMLIVLLIIGLFLEDFLFEAMYPTSRTALFYIPIISIFFYHLFLDLIEQYQIKVQYYIPVILCIVTPIVINFVAGTNVLYTTTWRYDAHTKDAMKTIRDYTQNIDDNASISNHWLLEPTINYYRNSLKLNLNSANRNGVNLNADFIYRLNDIEPLDSFRILNSYDDINSDLLIKTDTNNK